MKILAILLFTIISFSKTFAQEYPDCTNMIVEDIYLNFDNDLEIVISNNCLDCLSGMDGCVYNELRVIRTVAPFDTVAASNCNCLIGPNNNNSITHSISTLLTSVPDLGTIRVSLTCGSIGCEAIPFNSLLNVEAIEKIGTISIYPNPFNDVTNINIQNISKNANWKLFDMKGMEVRTISQAEIDTKQIKRGKLTSGQYILRVEENGVILAQEKLVIIE